ncbi:hypothetical protein [Xenorhabdus sp. PB30.3]
MNITVERGQLIIRLVEKS